MTRLPYTFSSYLFILFVTLSFALLTLPPLSLSLPPSFSSDFNEQLRSESVDSSTVVTLFGSHWIVFQRRLFVHGFSKRENLISLNNDAVHRSFSDDEDNGNDKRRLGRERGRGGRSIVRPLFSFSSSSSFHLLVSSRPLPSTLFKIQSLDFNPFAVLLTL